MGFKLGLQLLTPLQLLLLGTLVSWLVFLLASLWRRDFTLKANDRPLVVLLGMLNPTAYYIVLFAAYDRLPAHIAQPLNYTWAITLALLAVPLLGQHLSRQAMLGILVSYLGVVAVISSADASGGGQTAWLGVTLALASTLLWAAYWILQTRSSSDPLGLMFWSFSAALPVIGLLTWLLDGWPALTLEHFAYGLWVGAIEMGFTFLLWQQALRLTTSVARISQLIFFAPFLSLLLIHFVLGERISAYAVVGLMLIVTGVMLTNRAQSQSVTDP